MAKVIAGRLKHVLPNIIHEAQSAFIKGRYVSDYISLAHELCQDFLSSSKISDFAAKLDLCKAFDSINRASLLHRLNTKGFPKRFINWISACITDVKFSIVL